MKIGEKLLTVIRVMAMAEGAAEHASYVNGCDTETPIHWISMVWFNDWFKTHDGYYYMGFDHVANGFVVEWRGHTVDEKKYEHRRVVCGPSDGYLFDTAELLLRGIKNHKRYLKEELKKEES